MPDYEPGVTETINTKITILVQILSICNKIHETPKNWEANTDEIQNRLVANLSEVHKGRKQETLRDEEELMLSVSFSTS